MMEPHEPKLENRDEQNNKCKNTQCTFFICKVAPSHGHIPSKNNTTTKKTKKTKKERMFMMKMQMNKRKNARTPNATLRPRKKIQTKMKNKQRMQGQNTQWKDPLTPRHFYFKVASSHNNTMKTKEKKHKKKQNTTKQQMQGHPMQHKDQEEKHRQKKKKKQRKKRTEQQHTGTPNEKPPNAQPGLLRTTTPNHICTTKKTATPSAYRDKSHAQNLKSQKHLTRRGKTPTEGTTSPRQNKHPCGRENTQGRKNTPPDGC